MFHTLILIWIFYTWISSSILEWRSIQRTIGIRHLFTLSMCTQKLFCASRSFKYTYFIRITSNIILTTFIVRLRRWLFSTIIFFFTFFTSTWIIYASFCICVALIFNWKTRTRVLFTIWYSFTFEFWFTTMTLTFKYTYFVIINLRANLVFSTIRITSFFFIILTV